MDWTKLDAALAAAVSEDDAAAVDFRIAVGTVRMPSPEEVSAIPALEANPPTGSEFTAAVSLDDLERLSEEPWVRTVSLGQKLSPLQKGNSA